MSFRTRVQIPAPPLFTRSVGPLFVPHLAARSPPRRGAPSSPRLRPQAPAPSLRSGPSSSARASSKPRRYPRTGGGAPFRSPPRCALGPPRARGPPALAVRRRRLLAPSLRSGRPRRQSAGLAEAGRFPGTGGGAPFRSPPRWRSGRRVAAVPASPRLPPQALPAPSLRSVPSRSRQRPRRGPRFPGTGGGPLFVPHLAARSAAAVAAVPSSPRFQPQALIAPSLRSVPLTQSVGGPRRSRGATRNRRSGPFSFPPRCARAAASR